jgi:sugar transferase (PEP-CTERM/EpsH1 system associated)
MMAEMSRPTVLCLAHRTPFPPDKGDRIRTYHLLRSLARRARVHLACLADEPAGAEVLAELRRSCERVAVVPVVRWARPARSLLSLARGGTVTEGAFDVPALREVVRAWAAEAPYHAVLASASSLVPYLRLPELAGVPAVVDIMDVDSQKWLDYTVTARGPLAWLYRLEGRRLRRLEEELPSWAHAVTLVGEAEADLYRQFCRPGTVRAVTNGVDLDYFRPGPPAEGPTCVFVGALDYLPNVDGSNWFCREVWPEVVRRRPQAKLLLVGRRPAPPVRRLAGLPGVELVGQVPDVRPHVQRATVTVVPLRIARGIQNKILESLAMAKPTVASSPTLGGLKAEPGTHLLRADTPAEWAEAILRLFDDRELGRRLGAAGRRYVEENHRWDRCLEPFAELLGLPDEECPGPAAGRVPLAVGSDAR